MKDNQISISPWTILQFFLIGISLWVLYLILDIVVLFFIVLVIVAFLSPLVDRLDKFLPRILAVAIVYLVILGILAGAGFIILPPLIIQIRSLSRDLPDLIYRFAPTYETIRTFVSSSQQSLAQVSASLSQISTNLYTTTVGFLNGIFATITVLVLTFYLLLEKEAAISSLKAFLPLDRKEQIVEAVRKISWKMGGWLRGQIILMIIIGILYLIVLKVLGVPYALALAVFAGLLEIIPYIGPILGAAPAVLIGFLISPLTGVILLIWFIVVQQLESHFLVPKVMQKTVGLSPVVIILALLIGGKLFGILGAVLGVPAAAAISVLIQEWPNLRNKVT